MVFCRATLPSHVNDRLWDERANRTQNILRRRGASAAGQGSRKINEKRPMPSLFKGLIRVHAGQHQKKRPNPNGHKTNMTQALNL